VRIHAYNALGQEVATVLNSIMDAGAHGIVWHNTDNAGGKLPGGVYFLNFSTAQYSATRTMIFIR
jgi:flagellar hook assembly protein FlgD